MVGWHVWGEPGILPGDYPKLLWRHTGGRYDAHEKMRGLSGLPVLAVAALEDGNDRFAETISVGVAVRGVASPAAHGIAQADSTP